MDEKDLEAIEARAEAATEGPWFLSYCHLWSSAQPEEAEQLGEVARSHGDTPTKQGELDGEFIAHAREDIPRLTQALRAASARVKELEARHTEPGEGAP